MIVYRRMVRSAAKRIADAADSAVEDLAQGLVEQEPHLTDRLLGRIMQAMDGYRSKGVRWSAKTLTDHGPGTQEKRYGADFVGVLDVDLPEFKVKKGFLAQAKLLDSGRMRTSEFRRLVSQCEKMLDLSPDSFVFHESIDGIRVIPAISVVGASGPEVAFNEDAFYSRKISRFYEEHFECFIGDRRIRAANRQTLTDLEARALLSLAARAE
jgi:hypothetical protein